ncbi:hypothetical protein OG760_21140 [Streptomyces sp. NBC_00963]|uniref:WXG100-like domain-containing protein n=1 Tax=Streptomyces sp. NBC_00963 TaxID=2903697 RepID=UPI00386F7D36|nr:hypothetical protein OG760_21140 [Streptomyces sp. NBC_00963]
MVDLNPLHRISKANHAFGDTMASGLEFLGITDPAVDPDGVREIAKHWRALAKGLEDAAHDAEVAMSDVTWEGEILLQHQSISYALVKDLHSRSQYPFKLAFLTTHAIGTFVRSSSLRGKSAVYGGWPMSINLPHWLAEVVNILGFNWPEIDEDELREAAKELRKYAHHCEASHNTTHGIVTEDLKQVYAAQSYTALVQVWGGQTQKHMQELIEACRLLADGLDVAALGVEAMKDECIVQLGIAAAELIGDQAAAVFTLGLSEAAAVAEIEIQNKLMDGILKRFEQEVIGELVDRLIGPLKERIDHAVNKLVLEQAAEAVAGKGPGVKLDTEAMRGHGNRIKEQARANLDGGHTLRSQVSHLTFTTGG